MNLEPKDTKKPVLIFLHIPKTAGSTLRTVIGKQYKNSLFLKNEDRLLSDNETKEKIKNVDYIRVHYIFGVHRLIDRPFTYITMVRDPIDRVISEYYYARRKPEDALYEKTNQMDLEEFVNHDKLMRIRRFSNYQTHYLSGQEPPNLSRAIKNLNRHFSVVGLTEQFDESLQLFKKKFNWKDISYLKQNVTPNRPMISDFPPSVIKKLRSYNELDLKLYQYCKFYFEKEFKKGLN